MKNKKWNLPNLLTVSRFLLSPIFLYFIVIRRVDLALITFMFVAVTDFADGWVARSTNQKTDFGAFLDPMADKVMVFLALIGIVISFGFPLWAVPFFIFRDVISLSGSVLKYYKNKGHWSANKLGKVTTFMQVATIIAFIIQFQYMMVILYATLALSMVAGTSYIVRAVRMIKNWHKT